MIDSQHVWSYLIKVTHFYSSLNTTIVATEMYKVHSNIAPNIINDFLGEKRKKYITSRTMLILPKELLNLYIMAQKQYHIQGLDIEILGWCPTRSVLPHGEKVPWLAILLVMVPQQKYLMGQMFYYINQPHTTSFPIGLVEAESDFIVRSVETGLGR